MTHSMSSSATSPVPARYATARTDSRPTFGGQVAKVAAAMGTPLMPWQRQVLDVALEVLPDGSWAYRTIVCTVPRQAGKTTLAGPMHLHRALTRDRPTYFTAQSRQDARDTWLEVVKRLRRSPLNGAAKVRESNGSEAVTFRNGGTFRVFAPSEDALHGKANELVTVDEPWAFKGEQGPALEQAILPTFTTTGGQLVLISTAGTADSTWLRRYVDRGRESVEQDRRDGLAFFEWSLDPAAAALVAAGLDDEADDAARGRAFETVLAAHPASGTTVDRGALEQALDIMTPGQFLRAYGNVWTATADRVIPEHVWTANTATDWTPPEPGRVALAFDVAVDRSDAAIAAAWRDSDTGPLRFDVIDRHPGDAWLPGRLRELAASWRPVAIGYDKAGPARDVADELTRGGLELQGTSTAEYVAACAAFLAAVKNGRMQHPGRPALDEAVAAAATRPLGDSWAWSRRTSAESIAPLTAATLAGWTFDHKPAPATAPLIVSRRRTFAA